MTETFRDTSAALPDGTMPGRWEVPSAPERTWYVDQAAGGGGDGTSERPFHTIGGAAALAGPGERVLVRPGVYRETVRPARGGDGPDSMVVYEGEPGAVIRGSVVLPPEWTRAGDTWTIRLPEADFAEHNPFALANVDKSDPNNWQSTVPGIVSSADTLTRGLVFQDERRLPQVASPSDLAEPGFCVTDVNTLHVRTFDGADPNTVVMEATNRAQCFAPDEPGVSYVRLKGFVIEHTGNGFSYPVQAAVAPNGGHHWIVEDNDIRHTNADGLNIGQYKWSWGGDWNSLAGRDCIVRRNTFADCGVSAIKGMMPYDCLIEDNVFDGFGWQRVERWFDNGALKLLVCKNLLVRHNLIRGAVDSPGMWLDWDNINCRVTRNVVMDGISQGGGIFLEASEQTNWIDHNVVWNLTGPGIYQQDSDGLLVEHNVIGRCSRAAVWMRICTERKLHGRQVTCKDNVVRSNVLVDNGELVYFEQSGNLSDENLVIDNANPRKLADAQQRTGLDAASVQIQAQVKVDSETLTLTWSATADAWPLSDPSGSLKLL